MELLSTQRNEVLRRIQEASFDPADFVIFPGQSKMGASGMWVTRIEYRKKMRPDRAAFHYLFDHKGTSGEERYSFFSPAPTSMESWGAFDSWAAQSAHFAEWLWNLRREVEAPDLWAQRAYSGLAPLQGQAGDSSNEPFSAEEIRRVAESVAQLRVAITEIAAPTAEQLRSIDERLGYLEEASRRLGRVDWRGVGISVLVNITTSLATNGQTAASIFHAANVAFAWLTGHPLLPGGA